MAENNNPLLIFSIDAEEAESEYEDDDDALDNKQMDQSAAVVPSMPKMSWLLQIALENLGVTVCSYIVSSMNPIER